MELRKHRLLSGFTLNLGQLWFEFLTFPLIYFSLGKPDLALVTNISRDESPFGLIPDIFASFVYSLYLGLLTQSTNQRPPRQLEFSQHLTLSHTLLPVVLFVAVYLGPLYIMTLAFLLASLVWAWQALPQSVNNPRQIVEEDVDSPQCMELYLRLGSGNLELRQRGCLTRHYKDYSLHEAMLRFYDLNLPTSYSSHSASQASIQSSTP